MAKIKHITDKHGEIVYPISKEGAIYDDNGILLSSKISTFITRLVDNLANYYLKSELYTKEEIDTLIGAIQGFSYIVVSELPIASALTMGTIYLVPSEDPQTQNVKDEYITIRSGSIGSYTYSWEQIGSTAIDLSGYVTTEDLNTELAKYTTTANLTTLLAGKQDTIADLASIRSGASLGATAYQKPSSGIPASDIAAGVIPDISGKQDVIPDLSTIRSGAAAGATAYQKPSGGIPKTDLESGVQDSLDLADSAVQADPVGSVTPPVTPSDWATAEQVEELEAKVDENTNFIEPGGTDTLALNIGLIGANDGVAYPNSGGGKGLYSDAHSAVPGQVFTMSNPNSHGIVWHRAHFYMGTTYVRYVELGTTINNYTAPEANDYDTIRFCFWSNDNFTTSDITITTPSEDVYTPVKDVVESNEQRITALEGRENDTNTSINEISNGYRPATNADFTASSADKFKIENGSLYGRRAGTDPELMMLFNDGITGIEFEFAYLWDSNLIELCFGIGKDTGNSNKDCYAVCYLPTNLRPTDVGYVRNIDYDGPASNDQNASIWGANHFSGDYRQPQLFPATVKVGDKCRFELIDGHFFRGSIYNATSGRWEWWFCHDANGEWNQPGRMGWSTRKGLGFDLRFMSSGTTWKELVKNVRVTTESTGILSIYDTLSKSFPYRKNWVAIGDSITEINENNGLSYVGYAERKLGFKVDNQGHSGWTIYKLWRDRSEAGWEDAVSAINDGDIVTILAGTNDFDTATTFIPADDAAMDAAGNPHPRFGTTDQTSEDAKDPHTTLGCLRLMIERILTLKPGARLSVFSPFYREKGSLIGTTGWNKMYVNSEGRTIYDYADAIYSVAREYNLPAYNTCRDCGINAMTLATYTYDDLHIGQVGGELIGDYVAKRIS